MNFNQENIDSLTQKFIEIPDPNGKVTRYYVDPKITLDLKGFYECLNEPFTKFMNPNITNEQITSFIDILFSIAIPKKKQDRDAIFNYLTLLKKCNNNEDILNVLNTIDKNHGHLSGWFIQLFEKSKSILKSQPSKNTTTLQKSIWRYGGGLKSMLTNWYTTNLEGKEEGLLYKISYGIGLAVSGASYVFILGAVVFGIVSSIPVLIGFGPCIGSCSSPSTPIPIPDVSALTSTAQEIGSTMVQTATNAAYSAVEGLQDTANTIAEQSSQGLMVPPYYPLAHTSNRISLPPINRTSLSQVEEEDLPPPPIESQSNEKNLFEWVGYAPFYLVLNIVYYTSKGGEWVFRFLYKGYRILIDLKKKSFIIEKNNSQSPTQGGGAIQDLSEKTVIKLMEWIKKWFGGPVGVKVIPKTQMGGNKVFILGRHRVVKQKGRGKYIMYKGQLISLTEAKKIEKKLKKEIN